MTVDLDLMTKALDRLLVRDENHFDPEKHMERETEIIATKGNPDLKASNRQENMKNHEDDKQKNSNSNQVTNNNKEVITTRHFHTSQLGNLDLILWIMIILILFLLIILIYLLCLLCKDKR